MKLQPFKRAIYGLFAVLLILSACKQEVLEPDPPAPDPTPTPVDSTQQPSDTYTSEQFAVGGLDIEISIPPGYEASTRYPTIYVNDGDLFAEVYGSLTNLEGIDPFIMVGISADNTRGERFSAYEDPDLTATYGEFTPGADAYTQAIVDEVIPFVEGKYRSSKRALFGISLGGLHATWAGIKYPDAFRFIAALSPSYWVGNRALFEESLEPLRPAGFASPRVFYLDRGTAEWRNFLPFVESLKSVELVYAQNIFYYEVPGADHESPFWQARIDVPLRLFLEGIAQAALVDMELSTTCSDDLDAPGSEQSRLNPIVTYDNGVKFSVMTEAEFTVVAGSGSVNPDGTYVVDSGSSMTVECSYMGISKQVVVDKCN